MSCLSRALVICVALLNAAVAAAIASEAAPDKTPLLYDRLRAFPAVVIAGLPDGFQKDLAPVPSSNCVYLPIKIETALKGDLKPGDYRLNVHEGLPPLLAERDKAGPRRYLLALEIDKDYGYLGGGMLYTDLERFLPADPGLEKLAKAFIGATDVSPPALVKLCSDLLADKDVAASALALRQVNDVLARLAARTDEAAWKTVDKAALTAAVDRAVALVAGGKALDSAPALLLAVAARKDNPGDLKALDARLAEPARAWLAAQVAAPAVSWRPDYMQSPAMKAVIDLLGRLKDRAAKDLLVKLTRDNRWRDLRRPAYVALQQILPPEELKDAVPPAPPAKLKFELPVQ